MVEDYGIVVWVVGLKFWSLKVCSIQHTPYTRVRRLPWLRYLDHCCCSLLRPRSTSRFGNVERIPAAGTGPSESVTTHGSSSTPTHIITQSLPAYNVSDVSISSSSAAAPEEC